MTTLELPIRDAETTRYSIADDPRRLAVHRVVASEPFTKALRLCQFLTYISECALTDRVSEISEQQIGIHVFSKPADYNPSDDTIVRATARQLRQRLAVYYQEDGKSDPIRISIPKGGYIPSFSAVVVEESQQVFPSKPEVPPEAIDLGLPLTPSVSATTKPRFLRYRWTFVAGIASGLIMAFALFVGISSLTLRSRAEHPLWAALFNGNGTLIVAGDAGVNMFENLARSQVSVDSYAQRSYMNSPEAQTPKGYTWDSFASRSYTPMVDLRFAAELVKVPEARDTNIKIRSAREITAQDLKESNLIFLGAPQYDPWEQLFEKGLNFTVEYDGPSNSITIINHSPRSGEVQRYTWTPEDRRVGYAVVTLTDNLGGTGKVLLVQGTTAVGEAAGAEFLMSKAGHQHIAALASQGRGKIRNFQIVLQTDMTADDSNTSHVIAERVSDQ